MCTFTCDISNTDGVELKIIDNTAKTDTGRYKLDDNSHNKSTQTYENIYIRMSIFIVIYQETASLDFHTIM